MLIVIDGPEKVGKTTFIKGHLLPYLHSNPFVGKVHYVKQNQWHPDDSVVSEMEREHTESTDLYVWDRGWASEYVYATGLNRQRRANDGAFMMAWLHGRCTPFQYILLPPQVEILFDRRDDTDLPIDPRLETKLFHRYAVMADLKCFYLGNTASMLSAVDHILDDLSKRYRPKIYGNCNSNVLVLDCLSRGKRVDRWMPASSIDGYELFRAVGASTLNWAYAFVKDRPMLNGYKHVVTIGKEAEYWAKQYCTPAVALPRLYRTLDVRAELAEKLKSLKEI
jgi:hypothetical protein